MKKKHIVIAVIAVVVVAFLVMRNCSGGGSKYEQFEQKAELTPNETKVKGYLSEVLEVVDGTYTFDYKGSSYTGDGKIQVKLKSIGKGDPNDYGLNDGNHGPLYLTICDKNGTPLADFTEVESEYTSDGILKDMMTSNSENWISFKIGTYGGKKLPETAATFYITSKQIEKSEYSSSTSSSSSSDNDTDSDSDSENVSSSDNQDWDKVLDDYEDYVDKTLKIMNKLKNDDLSAMTEYPAMMEKAKDLEESLKKAQKSKSLSSTQVSRMMKIQTKMLQVAKDME